MSFHVASLIAEYYNSSTIVMKTDVVEYLPQLCPELVSAIHESHFKDLGLREAAEKFDKSLKEVDKTLIAKRKEIETEVCDTIARVESLRRTLNLPGNEDAYDVGTMALDSLERIQTLLEELVDDLPELNCTEVIEIIKNGGG
tara:strand:- start:81 stop:509 length:429 start_codon:yes stop_codon:yes gene_type:complete